MQHLLHYQQLWQFQVGRQMVSEAGSTAMRGGHPTGASSNAPRRWQSIPTLQQATSINTATLPPNLLPLALQEFAGAERIVQDVEAAGVTVRELQERRIVQDDRVEFTITDSAVLFGSPNRGSNW